MPGAYKRFSTSQIPSQAGVVAIVTGGNAGIGYETTKALVSAGAKVYMASRSHEKASAAIESLKRESPSAQVEFLQLDLSSLQGAKDSARAFREKESALHLLICNAGIMAVPYDLTNDGIEVQFQTNYLAHWVLFNELSSLMEAGARNRGGKPSRVVTLSSFAHKFLTYSPYKPRFDSLQDVNRRFGPWQFGHFYRYSQAKLSMIYFARQINERYKDKKEIRAAAVHPGFIASDLYKPVPGGSLFMKALAPLPDGALASLYVGTSDEVEKEDSWNQYRVTYGLPASQTG